MVEKAGLAIDEQPHSSWVTSDYIFLQGRKIMKYFYLNLSILIGALLSMSSANATYSGADGRIWREMWDTTGHTWNEIAAICLNGSSRICNGGLQGPPGLTGPDPIDLTGWTWATITEVGGLLKAETLGLHSGGIERVEREDSEWAPRMVGPLPAMAGPLAVACGIESCNTDGFTASTVSLEMNRVLIPYGMRAGVINQFCGLGPEPCDPGELPDYAWTDRIAPTDSIHGGDEQYSPAIWLYKNVSQVPVPSAVWLFGTGILGLIGIARRKTA